MTLRSHVEQTQSKIEGSKGQVGLGPRRQGTSRAGQKRRRGGDESGLQPQKKTRVSSRKAGTAKDRTIAFSISEEEIESWPELNTLDMSQVPLKRTSPGPTKNPKDIYRVEFRVASLMRKNRTPHKETFVFPYHKNSASICAFTGYVESTQYDLDNSMLTVLDASQAYDMSPEEFQAMVDAGDPIILTGQQQSVEFDVPTLFNLIDFRSSMLCIDSDAVDELFEISAREAAYEMCHWPTSRPLIVEHAPTAASLYQPVERLLNTHGVALADFALDDHHVRDWRGPMISAVGSVHPPHQNPNGLGISLYCASGHVVFFIPILEESQKLIVNFGDVDVQTPLGFEYLYQAPHRYGSFVLSAGQTVVFPPGQIYAYATISKEGSTSHGCIMHGSYFLAAGCMRRSASWLDRSSNDESTIGDSSVTTSLIAMVLKAVDALSTPDKEIVHSPDTANLFSLASMAMMFLGTHGPDMMKIAKALSRHCTEEGVRRYLRIANHAYKEDCLTSREREEYDIMATFFRRSMMTAVKNMFSSEE
ncbi:uncharacterized protein EI90DRAFT_3088223 [Cantharellus anzutake]|uniref:uncharacterized protein n=1 Tax=Cantharellus anzutake TaxID=1750568 RepID=UPI0019081385|nr:uncharacterized protein EI90DRAFT_3088223 [Cantharellus anzutake]KAF8315523.1 hypothetical protein EI90DRAFT_3088223 [Cantharellus anzutake]